MERSNACEALGETPEILERQHVRVETLGIRPVRQLGDEALHPAVIQVLNDVEHARTHRFPHDLFRNQSTVSLTNGHGSFRRSTSFLSRPGRILTKSRTACHAPGVSAGRSNAADRKSTRL